MFPDGFSPNGDGINETFLPVMIGVRLYNMKIFNRWGNIVFDVQGYNNKDKAWTGTSDGKWVIIKDLNVPDGTYFYSINLGDGSKAIGGFIVLKR